MSSMLSCEPSSPHRPPPRSPPGFVLEGTTPWELPEVLLGCLRLNYLDLKFAKPLNVDKEVPLLPPFKNNPETPARRTMHSRNPSSVPPQI